jgi:hypothetical protein
MTAAEPRASSRQRAPEDIVAAAPLRMTGGLELSFSSPADYARSLRALLDRFSEFPFGDREAPALAIFRLFRARGCEMLAAVDFRDGVRARVARIAAELAKRFGSDQRRELIDELIELSDELSRGLDADNQLSAALVALGARVEQDRRAVAHAIARGLGAALPRDVVLAIIRLAW